PGADVEHPRWTVAIDDRLERLETAGRGSVMARPERAAGLDRDHDPSVCGRTVPGWDDQESPSDGPGLEVDAPGVRPVFVGKGLDAKVGGRREAQLTQGVQVDPNAVRKRARGDRLRKERAERGAAARPGPSACSRRPGSALRLRGRAPGW